MPWFRRVWSKIPLEIIQFATTWDACISSLDWFTTGPTGTITVEANPPDRPKYRWSGFGVIYWLIYPHISTASGLEKPNTISSSDISRQSVGWSQDWLDKHNGVTGPTLRRAGNRVLSNRPRFKKKIYAELRYVREPIRICTIDKTLTENTDKLEISLWDDNLLRWREKDWWV
jgi:hypothetical protein